MSSGDKKPGAPKPFLGEAELTSELDAWDDMFDNLHGGPEAMLDAAPMEWPAPAPVQISPAPQVAPVVEEPTHALDERAHSEPAFTEPRGDHDLDAQMTLDNAIEDQSQRPAVQQWNAGPDETDFSDVGAEGAPAALGQMLGASELPQWNDDGEMGQTHIQPVDPEIVRGPVVPINEWNDDDDGVYTSASRPNVKAADDDEDFSLPDDPIAPPPKPLAAPPIRRSTPAIIRRTPVSMPVPQVPAITPPRGYAAQDPASEFAESTRIADVGEMEAKAEATRRADARSKAPTAPPPTSFTPAGYDEPVRNPNDDDDYEIEIGGSGAPPPVARVEPPSRASQPVLPRRTVAHVVRRADTPKPTTIAPTSRRSDPLIEMSHEEPGPAAEDDFSDVAAAVGAKDEPRMLPMDGPVTLGRAPRSVHSNFDAGPDEAAIDDQAPTQYIEEEDEVSIVASAEDEDAYVPMGNPLDQLDLPVDDDAIESSVDEPGPLAQPPVNDERFDRAQTTAIDRSQPPTKPPPTKQPTKPPPMASERPPALMDLYPRVKRPTSVPMMERPALARAEELPEVEPVIDVEAIGADSQWPEQQPPFASAALDEDAAASLLVYEREIPTVDEPTASAALRIEAGRLCERLGDTDRARSHYDAALLADPRATAALRGLRRLARAQGDLVEATRQLDAEMAVAGALERRPLGHYRVDLLMASGDYDLGRVAVGELLDTAPSDVRALLAQLELAFLDGRADEFGTALEQLAHAVTDNELRAAVQQARAMLAAHNNDNAGAVKWFAAATESDPGSLGARFGAIREAAAQRDGEAAGKAMVELATSLVDTDPATCAALALRAQQWTAGATATAASQLAMGTMAGDPLVARVNAEATLAGGDAAHAAAAMTAWANGEAPIVERAYAAARAAELDPAHGAELWGLALQLDPGDDYAAAQLRTAYVAADQTQLAIEVDVAVATDSERDRARLRAAFGMVAQNQLDDATRVLEEGHRERPTSLALAEALAEAFAAAGRWTERAKLLAELAVQPGEQLDRDVAQLRSALAWEEAVGAAASLEDPDHDEVQRATAAALAAWQKVLEQAEGASPMAHSAAIVLATRLGDPEVIGEVLARAQAAERSPWAAASLALRRARLAHDPAQVDAILDEAAPRLDDPRRIVIQTLAAARRKNFTDLAVTLDERELAWRQE